MKVLNEVRLQRNDIVEECEFEGNKSALRPFGSRGIQRILWVMLQVLMALMLPVWSVGFVNSYSSLNDGLGLVSCAPVKELEKEM